MTHKNKNQNKIRVHIILLPVLMAAVLYCSWPLGYYLNPKVGAHGLASELAATGQPYNWLFISTDVVAGLLIASVAGWLWWHRRYSNFWLKLSLFTYGLFGIFTALDAGLPLHCAPSLRRCPFFMTDHFLILHGAASIAGATCLFISAFAVWYLARRLPLNLVMSVVMIGWLIFGLLSGLFFFIPGPGYLAQHYFITLCSAWVILLPSLTLHFSNQLKEV